MLLGCNKALPSVQSSSCASMKPCAPRPAPQGHRRRCGSSSSRRQVAARVISLPWALPLSLSPTLSEQDTRSLELEGLQAQIASLSAQLQEAQRRAQFAESRMATLEARVQEGKALNLVHEATQAFRYHLAGLPAGVDPSMFYEDESRIIGKGGQATVYSFEPNYAVKVDRLSYRYSYRNAFEPERAADLLPAFLPPHRNVLAPKAWWVGCPPSPAQHHPQRVQAEPSWILYTLYDRFSCSLFDVLQQLRSRCAGCVAGQQGSCSQGAPLAGPAPMLLDLRSILLIVRDVAAALQHLAQHRVVHCDVKAENVLLEFETVPGGEGAPARQRVARAVLIDFGLARMLPHGVDKVDARGGTWMFKAPEQMSGPPGMAFGGQEVGGQPYVTQSTDVWSLGALICMLCHNGAVPASPGLPWLLPPDQLVKWGDRPNGRGGQEPFFMTWDDVLPEELCTSPPAGTLTAPSNSSSSSTGPAAVGAAVQGSGLSNGIEALLQQPPPPPRSCMLLDDDMGSPDAQQHAHVMSLLRRLAWGCMQTDPSARLSAAQVHTAAASALQMLG